MLHFSSGPVMIAIAIMQHYTHLLKDTDHMILRVDLVHLLGDTSAIWLALRLSRNGIPALRSSPGRQLDYSGTMIALAA